MAIDLPSPYQFEFIPSIKEIDALSWNQLTGSEYPFIQHEFLLALEQSQCISADTGWQPYHLIIRMGTELGEERNEERKEELNEGTMIGIMPLYLKTNSYGEYVFDWSWADFYHQNGIKYYPKLVTAIPFTPSAGARICLHSSFHQSQIIPLLIKHITEHAQALNISSWHLLFPSEELSEQLKENKLLQRLGCQYQWFNDDFSDFDNFLESFSSRKRKNIKKERKKIIDNEITFEKIQGKQITQEQWHVFFEFYQSTYFVRGRQAYLNEDFFIQLGATMPDYLLLVLAVKNNKYIAGALSFIGKDTLYGRYWGCSEEFQFLHFETCYYQGIEYCIKQKLNRFDSGAQGEHKIQRGFVPVTTYSNHWISHPHFMNAIRQFLHEEKVHIEQHISHANEFLPFKKS